jgi:hypothetical protein
MPSSQLTACAVCGQPILVEDAGAAVWYGGAPYHLGCAPSEAVVNAAEEYQAILRKGVRYFIEKYGGPADSANDLGRRFLALGRAVEEEQARRTKTSTRSRSGSAGK